MALNARARGAPQGRRTAWWAQLASWVRRRWARCLVVAVNVALLAGAGYVRWAVNHEQLVTIQVAVGSEDLAFLQNSQVLGEFTNQGLTVQAYGFGSGQLASTVSPRGYDAFFVSSQLFAEETEDVHAKGIGQVPQYVPFSTPLMVYTWGKLIPLLERIGVVNNSGQFDIGRYLEIANKGMRWNQIPGNTFYHDGNQVLLQMTDPAKSDSGAMFVAAASYVENHDTMVQDAAQVAAVAPAIANMIAGLGQMPPTTNDVFLAYQRGGMNSVPLALGYQSEGAASGLPPGGVALPLDFPVDCQHVVVAFDRSGRRFGDLLDTDPVLQSLEQKFGFEVGKGVRDPRSGFDINPPIAKLLQELIADVDPGQ